MATTSPDNIQYPVNSDQVAPLASHFKNVADSTQAALNNKASTGSVAAKVAKAGDTMTGALVLSGDPTLALHAATKQYVDAGDAALQEQITSNLQTSRMYVKNGSTALTKGTPVYITGADGTNVIVGAASNATEGGSSKTIGLLETDLAINAMGYVVTAGLCTNIDTSGAGAAGDPVWLGVNGAKIYGLSNKPVAPAHMVYLGVVTRKNANTGEIEVRVQNGFELDELHNVSINSGTLADKQVLAYESASQLWKNKQATGGVTVGATAPAGPNPGDAWYNSNNGMLYVWYVDADSTAQWVQVKANSGLEASILSRLGGLEAQAIAYGNPNPNLVLNSGFDIWQRGLSITNGYPIYGADRWMAYGSGNGTNSRQPTGDTTNLPNIQYCQRMQRTAGNSTTNALYTSQSFETSMSRQLCGQVVTLSWYARAGANFSATANNMIYELVYGTGTDQNVIAGFTGQAVAVSGTKPLTTTWQRFTATATIPATATQVALNFYYIPTGTAGTNDYLEMTGIQLEKGNTATAFRRNQPNIQAELAACQRYYYRMTTDGNAYTYFGTAWAWQSTSATVYIPLPVTMRIPPTTTLDWSGTVGHYRLTNSFSNFVGSGSGPSISSNDQSTKVGTFNFNSSGLATGAAYAFTANSSAAYIGFSAEL